ncbi:hypothetical protein V1515DRAFT_602266, partial [Lipomyces mesembrius]
YLDQLLNCGHSGRIKGALRMSRDTFISLHNWLVNHTHGAETSNLPTYRLPASFTERYYGTLLCWK